MTEKSTRLLLAISAIRGIHDELFADRVLDLLVLFISTCMEVCTSAVVHRKLPMIAFNRA